MGDGRVGVALGAAAAGHRLEARRRIEAMDETRMISHAQVTSMLRMAGYSQDRIDDILSEFPDPVDLEHAREKLLHRGISLGALMDRLGASP